jgi:hypothetical protein
MCHSQCTEHDGTITLSDRRDDVMDETDVIREVNASNVEVENQYLRARQAADVATRSKLAAAQASSAARDAEVTHQAVQEERPRRRAPLPRQLAAAAGTVALDGVACYFAAQVLDGSQDSTLLWTGLFLVALGGGEAALDFYRDRDEHAWRMLAVLIAAFITLLGTLRFWFLMAISDGSLVTGLAGAGLFTAATAAFLCLGYRFLRAAETPTAWQARRQACRARRAARGADAMAERDVRERDRYIDAYLVQVRRLIQRSCPAEQHLALESAIRRHLCGGHTE